MMILSQCVDVLFLFVLPCHVPFILMTKIFCLTNKIRNHCFTALGDIYIKLEHRRQR